MLKRRQSICLYPSIVPWRIVKCYCGEEGAYRENVGAYHLVEGEGKMLSQRQCNLFDYN